MTHWHDWYLLGAFWFDVAVRVFAVVWIPRNRRPQTAMAWLLLILVLPTLGLVAYLVLGSAKLPRARRRRQREVNERLTEMHALDAADGGFADVDERIAGIVELNRRTGALPLTERNSATLYPDSDASIAAMVESIDAATESVHVEFYILTMDDTTRPFFDALAAAAARGVVVRVLMDHLASRGYPGYRRTKRRLSAAGVQWHLMLPLRPFRGQIRRPDLRNHRKLVVVDGLTGFCGSQNLIDAGYHQPPRTGFAWLDLMARFEGPVAASLDAVFATDWYSETDELLLEVRGHRPDSAGDGPLACQVVPSGPGFEVENSLRMFASLLYSARRRVSITSPYFIPDETMLAAITTAAQRGVAVELFVGAVGDHRLTWHAQRSYYEALLVAGVRVFEYPAPTILHAKHLSVDDDVAVIGSSNMDARSFSLNLELSVMVHGPEFVAALRQVEDGYRAVSTELSLDPWRRRPARMRALDNAARLTSALQ